MNERIHAKLTEENGILIAYALSPDNQIVENVVLDTLIPIPSGPTFHVVFYDMSKQRAVEYSTARMAETILALAQAGEGVAQETERWYTLTAQLHANAALKRNRLTKDLSNAVDDVGWLNPIVLNAGQNRYIFDLALADESVGREAIAKIMRRWSISDWSLEVKLD